MSYNCILLQLVLLGDLYFKFLCMQMYKLEQKLLPHHAAYGDLGISRPLDLCLYRWEERATP